MTFAAENREDPFFAAERTGAAAYAAIGATPQAQMKMRRDGLGLLIDLFNPVISIGVSSDEEKFPIDVDQGDGTTRRPHPINRTGGELTLANIFSYRWGRIDDPEGFIVDNSSGWSIGIRYGQLGGVRYDRATIPQATDPNTGDKLADVKRKAISIFVDPLEIIPSVKSGNEGRAQ